MNAALSKILNPIHGPASQDPVAEAPAVAADVNAHSPWKRENPPKDGTWIIAVGKVMYEEDGCCTVADPFVDRMRWTENEGESAGWHYASGMSVARTLEDEVIVHFWLEDPCKNP